jgi:hypothetical protein
MYGSSADGDLYRKLDWTHYVSIVDGDNGNYLIDVMCQRLLIEIRTEMGHSVRRFFSSTVLLVLFPSIQPSRVTHFVSNASHKALHVQNQVVVPNNVSANGLMGSCLKQAHRNNNGSLISVHRPPDRLIDRSTYPANDGQQRH